MSQALDTGIKNAKNVLHYTFGQGTVRSLSDMIENRRHINNGYAVYFVDQYFEGNVDFIKLLSISDDDELIFISTGHEPTTKLINSIKEKLTGKKLNNPSTIIGCGGGIVMDVAKAVANLLTNDGNAEDYQGWDLVKNQGIYKIAVPTLSGTGAEATRTCVMTNKKSGLKLGMNSDYTVYDQVILDPDLTKTVPRNQYFYTGMDAYIHCIESLNGSYRNAIGDAFSQQTITLCREIFASDDMMTDESRSKMMVASYLGGCAIATSYVGIIHPFSAGLSVVLGLHHCMANCIVMRAMEEFYPTEYKDFWQMAAKQNVEIPSGICDGLSDEQFDALYASTVIHEKPLINALGENFKVILTKKKVKQIFSKM